MLSKVPIIKVTAKPLTKLLPSQNKIKAAINKVKLPSQIAGQALLNPSSRAAENGLPCRNSSLILEKIRMLPSTAIPMDKINPPMPANVKVTGINLNKAKFRIA